MKKIVKYVAFAVALAVSSPVVAEYFKLPIGVCVAELPNNQCGVLWVNSQRSFKYMAGKCRNGALYGRTYKAKKIKRTGNTIVVDDNFKVTIKWLSPRKKTAKVNYSYTDKNGTHTGRKNFSCL